MHFHLLPVQFVSCCVLSFYLLQDVVIRVLLDRGIAAIPLQMDFNIASFKTKKD